MNEHPALQLRLTCQIPGGHCPLEIALTEVPRPIARAVFRLRIVGDTFIPPEITYPVAFDRDAIETFAEELRQLCEHMEGTARLCDTDATTVLSITAMSRGRETCAVGGELCNLGSHSEYACEDRFLQPFLQTAGMVARFDGLVIDQAQLAKLREAVDMLLRAE